MRFLLDGVEGGQIDIFKGTDKVMKVRLIGDDGAPIDCSSGTFTIEVYDTEDRRNAVSVSLAVVMDGDLDVDGYGLCTLAEATISGLSAGGRYYGFAKSIISTVTTFGNKPSYLNVK